MNFGGTQTLRPEPLPPSNLLTFLFICNLIFFMVSFWLAIISVASISPFSSYFHCSGMWGLMLFAKLFIFYYLWLLELYIHFIALIKKKKCCSPSYLQSYYKIKFSGSHYPQPLIQAFHPSVKSPPNIFGIPPIVPYMSWHNSPFLWIYCLSTAPTTLTAVLPVVAADVNRQESGWWAPCMAAPPG